MKSKANLFRCKCGMRFKSVATSSSKCPNCRTRVAVRQKTCDWCGKHFFAEKAETCSACASEIRQYFRKLREYQNKHLYTCPDCGGKKAREATLCRLCRFPGAEMELPDWVAHKQRLAFNAIAQEYYLGNIELAKAMTEGETYAEVCKIRSEHYLPQDISELSRLRSSLDISRGMQFVSIVRV